jgi:hypothetical protein
MTWDKERDPNAKRDPITGELVTERKFDEITDQVMRHLIVGVEIFPSKNFHIRAGYNYQRRQELKVSSLGGAAGFSLGFGLKISKFRLDYGRAIYHQAGASNHFSFATNLSEFNRRKP